MATRRKKNSGNYPYIAPNDPVGDYLQAYSTVSMGNLVIAFIVLIGWGIFAGTKYGIQETIGTPLEPFAGDQ